MRIAQTNPKAKQTLLDAAEDLMLTQGYSATSVDQICKAAKLTKGSFFHYFKSKEDLAAALLNRFCCSSRQMMQEKCCTKEMDPLNRVYNYIDCAVQMFKDSRFNKGCLIGTFAQELAETKPKLRSLCAEGFNEWAKLLKKDLKEAKKKYAPRASFEAESLAEHFIALVEGSQILARAKSNPAILGENMRHFKQYLKQLFGR